MPSGNIVEDDPVTPDTQTAEPGQVPFQCADVTFAMCQAPQGIADPAARFGGK